MQFYLPAPRYKHGMEILGRRYVLEAVLRFNSIYTRTFAIICHVFLPASFTWLAARRLDENRFLKLFKAFRVANLPWLNAWSK